MPRVPVTQGPSIQQQGIGTPYASARAPAGTFGEGLAQGVGNAAQVAFGIGQQERARLEETEAREADVRFSEQIRNTLYDPQTGFFAKKGRDVLTSFGDTQKALEESLAAAGQGLSPGAMRLYERVARSRLASTVDGMAQYRTREFSAWEDGTSTARIESLGSDALAAPTRPDLVNRAIGAIRTEVVGMGSRNGWSPEMTMVEAGKRESAVHLGVAARLFETDPAAGLSYAQANQGRMTGADLAALDAQRKVVEQRLAVDRSVTGVLTGVTPPPPDQASAVKRFADAGYGQFGGAALVGAFVWEAGGGLNPRARNPGDGADGSDSVGVGQWNADRARNLAAFAARNGLDPWALDTQLAFVVEELSTTHKDIGDRLKAATSIEEAAEIVAAYEKPSGYSDANPRGAHGWDQRLANAKKMLGAPSGQPAAVTSLEIRRAAAGISTGDPQVDAAVRARLEQQADLMDLEKKTQDQQTKEAVIGRLVQNPSAAVTPQEEVLLRAAGGWDTIESLRRGEKLMTDQQVWTQLQLLPDADLAAVSPGDYIGKLSTTDYQKLVDDVRKARQLQVNPKRTETQTATSIADTAFKAVVGKPADNAAGYNAWMTAFQAQVSVLEAQPDRKGKLATPEELQGIADRLSLDVRTKKPGGGWVRDYSDALQYQAPQGRETFLRGTDRNATTLARMANVPVDVMEQIVGPLDDLNVSADIVLNTIEAIRRRGAPITPSLVIDSIQRAKAASQQ